MLPLAGIRVVEAGQMISAPMAGAIMAEQGAEVIKVELADGVGDRLRQLGTSRNSISSLFNSVNRGKQSVTLDTKHPDGLQALLDQGKLFAAGPHPALDTPDPGDAGFTGSLIIAEFDSLEAATAWADSDPYVDAGVFSKVSVKPYKLVLP